MGYELDFSAILASLGLLLKGAGLTLVLTVISATLGLALSIGGAATRRWGLGWAQWLVGAYVEVIRNTPFIVQLFFIFFGPVSYTHLDVYKRQAWLRAIRDTAPAYARPECRKSGQPHRLPAV